MTSVYVRLWVMMFLQYFVWGAWWVTLGSYIGANQGPGQPFEDGFIGIAYSTYAWGAIIAPFAVGMIADRFFPTQWVLAALHIAGAVILFFARGIEDQSLFFWTLFVYYLCYMPTLALTNSLSFHNLKKPGEHFPYIRVAGTLGWIVAGLSYVGYAMVSGVSVKEDIEPTTIPMLVASLAQIVLGVFCIVLPHTPPPAKGKKVTAADVLGLDALRLLRKPGFTTFIIGSFLICIPLQFYYGYTNRFLNSIGMENAVGKMTIGQMSETLFMVLMPMFFVRLGVKWMLLVGMISWFIRYVLFAFGDVGEAAWMLYIGIALHGICYDFFFVTGQIYVDRKAGAAIRGAAQGFITFITLGVGALVGTVLSGWIERVTDAGGENWTMFWLIPAGIAIIVAGWFAFAFNDPEVETADEGELEAEATGSPAVPG